MADKKLWEVMDAAMDAVIGERLDPTTWRKIRAAELRAIADEVAPEVAPPNSNLDDRAWGAWEKQLAIRQRLLDAANEAEGGS